MSALALALAAMLAAADEVEEERLALQERLDAEKSAFDALESEKKSLLTLLDTLERLARESNRRAQELEKSVTRITTQIAAAKADGLVVQRAVLEQQHKLAPRLAVLYRLQRRDELGALLSASDFSTLIKRQRAVKTLVETDVRALDELATVARYQQLQGRRLERLEGSAEHYLKALRTEQAIGRARLARFQELAALVSAEQNQKSRVIAELEANERELAGMVAELQSTTAAQGLRAKKGKLPWPTQGLVEVGFGKVVNPRFNTVTVQKGIDLRAAVGTPVVSVGVGTVVYAGWLKGYGNLVIVDHGGAFHSLYAHLDGVSAKVAEEVEEGQDLGTVGDTGSLKGPYLYFEIRKQGQAIDPLPWLLPEAH